MSDKLAVRYGAIGQFDAAWATMDHVPAGGALAGAAETATVVLWATWRPRSSPRQVATEGTGRADRSKEKRSSKEGIGAVAVQSDGFPSPRARIATQRAFKARKAHERRVRRIRLQGGGPVAEQLWMDCAYNRKASTLRGRSGVCRLAAAHHPGAQTEDCCQPRQHRGDRRHAHAEQEPPSPSSIVRRAPRRVPNQSL